MSRHSLDQVSLVNKIPNPCGTNLDTQSLKTLQKHVMYEMGVRGTESSAGPRTKYLILNIVFSVFQ